MRRARWGEAVEDKKYREQEHPGEKLANHGQENFEGRCTISSCAAPTARTRANREATVIAKALGYTVLEAQRATVEVQSIVRQFLPHFAVAKFADETPGF